MASVFGTPTTNQATTGTAVSVARPTGTTDNHVVSVAVHGNGQITISDNNTGTEFDKDFEYKPNTSSGHTVAIFSRIIQSGDPSTYNFTLSSSGGWGVVATTVEDVDLTNIYDNAPGIGNSFGSESASSVNAPTITTATDNALHFAIGAVDSQTATLSSTPATYAAVNAAGGGRGISVATKVITPAGATGAQAFSFSETTGVMGISYSLKDVGAGVGSVVQDIIGGVVPFPR